MSTARIRTFIVALVVALLGSAFLAQPAGAAVVVHKSETLGAYSETWNRFTDGHRYELHTFVRDTIPDHHLCAYVKYRIQYKQSVFGVGETTWINVGRAAWRVNACDIEGTNTATLDMNDMHLQLNQISAFRLEVSTCEDIPRKTDRCTNYHTKTRHP